jgi:hypothetical protein
MAEKKQRWIRNTYDCGCQIFHDGGGIYTIQWCGLHKQAPDLLAENYRLKEINQKLLEACKFSLDMYNNIPTPDFEKGKDKPARDLLEKTIALAEKEK